MRVAKSESSVVKSDNAVAKSTCNAPERGAHAAFGRTVVNIDIASLKYRLAYVVQGECVLRYDNERGKGDHRHVGTTEWAYAFTTPDQLMLDFNADIARWNHEHGHA